MADPSKKQGKYWCFTYNNPACAAEHFIRVFKAAGASYIVFGEETAPETGTPHWQGYVEFDKVKRFGQVRRLVEGLHVEYRLGTQQQAIDYCKGLSAGKTPNEVVHEDGTPTPNVAGRRNDIHDAVETLKSGGLAAVAEENPIALVKYPRGMLLLQTLLPHRAKPNPEVILLFGPTGCGKTKRFFDECSVDNYWRAPITDGIWFDGYCGQPDALFDDFDGKCSKWSLRFVLQLLDRYPINVPTKGGFVEWVPERIYITTNFFPRLWYDWSNREQQWPALVRRISRVIWWKSVDGRPLNILRPDPELSDDVESAGEWEHFWNGPDGRQLELDRASGRLVSHAPPSVYDW